MKDTAVHKSFLAAASIVAAMSFVVSAPAAQAREYPFCIKGDSYLSAVGDCSFDTYQQCQATASGRLAYCDANPFYRPPADDRIPGDNLRRRQLRR